MNRLTERREKCKQRARERGLELRDAKRQRLVPSGDHFEPRFWERGVSRDSSHEKLNDSHCCFFLLPATADVFTPIGSSAPLFSS